MHHCSEEDLILQHYGEHAHSGAITEHLRACGACRDEFARLQDVLNAVSEDAIAVPERGETYGREVWQRVAPRLTRSRFEWIERVLPRWHAAPTWATAGAFAVLLLAAFIAGRYSTRDVAMPTPAPKGPIASSTDAEPVRERVLLVAVGDHLDRSHMVLAELLHAAPEIDGRRASVASRPVDISGEQEWAQDLVASNRLYRQTAAQTGQTNVESVLDELEPILLEIAHSPSSISPDQLSQLKQRIEAQGLLFKIRIVESNVRERERTTRPRAANPVS